MMDAPLVPQRRWEDLGLLARMLPRWPRPVSRPIPFKEDWPLCRYFAWRIGHDRDTRLIKLEDKLCIKDRARSCRVPFVPTLTELEPETLDIGRHPDLDVEHFVLKMNHGWDDLVIVRRLGGDAVELMGSALRGTFSLSQANSLIRRHFIPWKDFVHEPKEWAVARIRPRTLFAEPYLTHNDDFKVWVVLGKSLFTSAMTGRWESGAGPWGGIFAPDWEYLGPARHAHARSRLEVENRFPVPPRVADLYSYAERIAPPDMTILRVDFYKQPDGQFVLGEATCYSAGGGPHTSPDLELELGRRVGRALGERNRHTAHR